MSRDIVERGTNYRSQLVNNTSHIQNVFFFNTLLTCSTHPLYFSWKTSCCWYKGSRVLLAVAVLALARHLLPLTRYTLTQGAKKNHIQHQEQYIFWSNTSYLTDSYIVFTIKMESVSKNTIFGLEMMVKNGLGAIL